jgi:hypothetical protein
MPFNPVAEDTHDKFTGIRKRLSHPARRTSGGIPRDVTQLTLGFLESGDSAELYLHVLSDASSWRFYSDLWVLAGGQRYQLQLSRLRGDTHLVGYNVRCVEEFSVLPIDSGLLRTMLAAPRWELRLSGQALFETAIEQLEINSWRVFYRTVLDPSSFPNIGAVAAPRRAGCLGIILAGAVGSMILFLLRYGSRYLP